MKKLLLAAAAVAASGAAHAANLGYDSYNWYGLAIQIDAPTAIYGGAGQIQLYSNGSLVADAWCMDIANYLTASGHDALAPFTSATVAGGLSGVPTDLTQVQLNTIATLVVNGNSAVQGGASASDSAAYQVAIWSVEIQLKLLVPKLGRRLCKPGFELYRISGCWVDPFRLPSHSSIQSIPSSARLWSWRRRPSRRPPFQRLRPGS
jgi:hypothetical protein